MGCVIILPIAVPVYCIMEREKLRLIGDDTLLSAQEQRDALWASRYRMRARDRKQAQAASV
jgi:hypothetical protein